MEDVARTELRYSSPRTQPMLERVEGRADILEKQGELERLARGCGQAGAASHLKFFLTDPLFGSKVPHLLLFRSHAQAELEGAVLLYEYTFFGVRSGMFISPDAEGERTVIAPAERREEFAWRAAMALLAPGTSRLLLLSLQGIDFGAKLSSENTLPLRAAMQRTFRNDLRLKSDFDETLAQFGPRTRRNLRAAKRQALQREAIEFIPEATVSEEEYMALSHASAYAVREEVARWRYASVRDGGLLAGLRDEAGKWLALIGGRRESGVTTVDWQINPKELNHLSLSLTMRAFLIEHEVARETRVLRFEGGTPHPMHSGFAEQVAGYALLGRGWMRPAVVRHLVRRVLPAKSLVNTWIKWDELTWYR